MAPAFSALPPWFIFRESTCQIRSPPPLHPGGFPERWQLIRSSALSDCCRCRFSSRKYSPPGLGFGTRTSNAMSDRGLQDVVADSDLFARVAGPVIFRHVAGTEREAVSPEVVLRRGGRAAFAARRLVHEQHQRHEAARRIDVLREVNLCVELGER